MTELTESEKMILTKYDIYFEGRLTRVETIAENLSENVKELKFSLESFKKEIHSDFKWLFGIMLGFCGIILSLMAKGFHWL